MTVLFESRKPSKRILKFVPRQNSASKAKDFALIVMRKITDVSQRPSQVILPHDFRVNGGNPIVIADRVLGFVVAFCFTESHLLTLNCHLMVETCLRRSRLSYEFLRT